MVAGKADKMWRLTHFRQFFQIPYCNKKGLKLFWSLVVEKGLHQRGLKGFDLSFRQILTKLPKSNECFQKQGATILTFKLKPLFEDGTQKEQPFDLVRNEKELKNFEIE